MAYNLSAYFRENINIEVLLNDNIPSAEINKMKAELSKKPYVKSITYISKEDAAKTQVAELGVDPKEFLGYNPFIASFELFVNAEYANKDSLAVIGSSIGSNENVMGVEYPEQLIEAVNSNIKKISFILLIIAALFTYISFALINNTVKLTIFSKRFMINTMKLVGASWGFIRRPFMKRALLLGICSAIVADGALWGILEWIRNFEPSINTVIDWKVLALTGSSVFVLGLVITILCTYFSLWKYLRISSNALYKI